MSATSFPVGGGWVGIGSGLSVRIDLDGDGSGELPEVLEVPEQADSATRRSPTATAAFRRGLVTFIGVLTPPSSRTSDRDVLRSR
ncbi:hypothetical protein [Nocardioides conyzicola]|uniref:Uncharacterized protein n=1 Tax=Nocardioides conyzicola TaxID=1651781 RepID=A0ABP8XSE6_9ACTN